MATPIRRKPLGDVNGYLPVSITTSDSSYENEYSTPSIVSSIHETNQVDSENQSTGHLKRENSIYYEPTPAYVSWGIHWLKPALIISMLLLGLGLALSHHFFYKSLNNERAGDTGKQAWSTRIGTALAILVAFVLKTGTGIVLGQYVWTTVTRRGFTMANLDRLFSLSSDPYGLLNLDLLKGARVAVFLGIVLWFLQLTSVAPPATLTVIARNISREAFTPSLNSSLSTWNNQQANTYEPTEITNILAQQASTLMDVVPLIHPVSSSGWSYRTHFFGPTLQCSIANSTEQRVFDNVTRTLESQNDTWVFADSSNTNFSKVSKKLVWSSWCFFCPSSTPNNWRPTVFTYSNIYNPYITPQIWVQTSTSGIVCNSMNASFDITVSSIGGRQQITQNAITVIGNYELPFINISDEEITVSTQNTTSAKGGEQSIKWNPYLAHLYALGALLSGNIKLDDAVHGDASSREHWLTEESSSVVFTGLVACDEIANSAWRNVTTLIQPTIAGAQSTFDNTFPSQPWMCRNRTLAAGIQDLANNISISYLSSLALSSLSAFPHLIVTSDTDNFYEYHPLWLFISYGVALFFSAIATVIGFYALYVNGASHSTSFSAIVATTRNPQLDVLLKGSSLGADPMMTDKEKTRLRFGPLLSTPNEAESKITGAGREEPPHVAFGFEENVGTLRKGEIYK